MSICSDLFNQYCFWSFTNKTYNKNKAHHSLYKVIRQSYPDLPSALVQSIRDTAMEAVKASKFKSIPRSKPTSSIRYDRRTFTLRGNQLTLSCIGKRIKTILPDIPDYFKDKTNGWRLAGLTLSYRKNQKRFFVNLTYGCPDPPQLKEREVQGLDRGLHHLVVTSDGQTFSNKKIRASQRKRLYQRRQLQAKGTRSAKRRLRTLSGKEKRFSRDVNHCVTKALVNQENVTTFVLEDLSGIRNKRRGKVLNKHIGSWPFCQFEMFLGYKAIGLGKSVEYVDARYTSQRCNRCGYVDKENRYKSKFWCKRCGNRDHADENSAKNIRDRYLLSTAEYSSVEQVAVNQPYVTGTLHCPKPSHKPPASCRR